LTRRAQRRTYVVTHGRLVPLCPCCPP